MVFAVFIDKARGLRQFFVVCKKLPRLFFAVVRDIQSVDLVLQSLSRYSQDLSRLGLVASAFRKNAYDHFPFKPVHSISQVHAIAFEVYDNLGIAFGLIFSYLIPFLLLSA